MARALPPRATAADRRTRASWLLALVPALAVGSGCNSDDPYVFTTDIDLTTGAVTTEVVLFTTGEPDYTTSTGDPPPSEESCRDAIKCLGGCIQDLIANPGDPEPDYSCFLTCTDKLSVEEVLKFFRLTICVSNGCYEQGPCGDGSDAEMCRNCIIFALDNQQNPFPGCEAEVAECK